MNYKIIITNDFDIDFRYLCKAVDFDIPFTLGDIIRAVNSSSHISRSVMSELLNCSYLTDYLEEMNKPITEEDKDDKEDGKIEYLQINWMGDKSEYSDGIYMDSRWEFDGIGEKGFVSRAQERGITEIDPEHREHYALEFTPVNKLAHLQIKMCPKMCLRSREKDENKNTVFNDVKMLFTPDISLLDLLHAIFGELSMLGSPEQRDEEKNVIKERFKSIKDREDNGTLVTVPWEQVKARLNKTIEDIRRKKEEDSKKDNA